MAGTGAMRFPPVEGSIPHEHNAGHNRGRQPNIKDHLGLENSTESSHKAGTVVVSHKKKHA